MSNTELRFLKYLADVPDPRVDRSKKHLLDDILVITLCAVICGAESFEEIERFGKARRHWLEKFLRLPHGIPSHDTFNRVLAALDRDKFSQCFARWMSDLCVATGLRAVAVDGKACRSAPGDTFSHCLHLVSVWATENNLFLGQAAVDNGSHEIVTIPKLLAMLDLKGALVTIDAAGCQKGTLQEIQARGGDYLVTVKGNQPTLHDAVASVFVQAGENEFSGCDMSMTVEDGHGRHEERYVSVIQNPVGIPSEWSGVGSVVRVARERAVHGKNTSSVTYYLTSLRVSAEELGKYVRGHWGIENGLHWCLDMSFGEDRNRTRDTNAGANLGVVRRVSASLLKQDTSKGSIKAKRLNCALDPDYLLAILNKFPVN